MMSEKKQTPKNEGIYRATKLEDVRDFFRKYPGGIHSCLYVFNKQEIIVKSLKEAEDFYTNIMDSVNISDLRGKGFDVEKCESHEFMFPFDRGGGFRQYGLTKMEYTAIQLFCSLIKANRNLNIMDKNVVTKELWGRCLSVANEFLEVIGLKNF